MKIILGFIISFLMMFSLFVKIAYSNEYTNTQTQQEFTFTEPEINEEYATCSSGNGLHMMRAWGTVNIFHTTTGERLIRNGSFWGCTNNRCTTYLANQNNPLADRPIGKYIYIDNGYEYASGVADWHATRLSYTNKTILPGVRFYYR